MDSRGLSCRYYAQHVPGLEALHSNSSRVQGFLKPKLLTLNKDVGPVACNSRATLRGQNGFQWWLFFDKGPCRFGISSEQHVAGEKVRSKNEDLELQKFRKEARNRGMLQRVSYRTPGWKGSDVMKYVVSCYSIL